MGTIILDVRSEEISKMQDKLSQYPEIQIGDLVEIFLNDFANGEPSLEPYLEKVNAEGSGNSIDRYFTHKLNLSTEIEGRIRFEINRNRESAKNWETNAESYYQDYLEYCKKHFRKPEGKVMFYHHLYELSQGGKRCRKY